ncbi:MAG: hypothetical protein K0U84_08120 [Actinomycetia bacterium]|nr:hypothetical protein [Actinomycetes bacterium]
MSQIQDWDVEHLEDAAQRWSSTAQLWEDTFESMHRGSLNPGGTVWEGEAAEAAQQHTFADVVKVRGLADVLREASSTARWGASDLQAAQRNALTAIEAAQAAGFTVGEDLSVSAPTPMATLLRGGRQAEAEELAADIATRATALSALDQEVATKITTITAPLHETNFNETPLDNPNNNIHALENNTTTASGDATEDDDGKETTHVYLFPDKVWEFPGLPPPPRDSAPGGGRWEVEPRSYPSGPDGHPPAMSGLAPLKPWRRDFTDAPVKGAGSGLVDIVPVTGEPAWIAKESYQFRLVGEGFNGAPDHVRWIKSDDGGWSRATWVDYDFEALRTVSTPGQGDFAGLPNLAGFGQWHPMDIKDIYALQVRNPRLPLYLPDPGGGQFFLDPGREIGRRPR